MSLDQPVSGLIITGIPRLYAKNSNQYPDSSTPSASQIQFNYADALADPEQLILLSGDQAVRTAEGGFLAALNVVVNP